MNISELIEFHKKGAESCEAYSGTPPDTRAVTKDICKHYQKKAAWHRDAVALLEKESTLQKRLTAAEKLLGNWYAANAAGGILVADEDYHLVTATAEMLEQESQKEGEGHGEK